MYQLTVSRSATQSVNKICSEMDALSIAFSRNEDCSKGKNHAELNFLFKYFDLFFDLRIWGWLHIQQILGQFIRSNFAIRNGAFISWRCTFAKMSDQVDNELTLLIF